MHGDHIEFEGNFDLDAVRKLYRNKERIDLYRLIRNTHPTDVAWGFRYLSHTERREIFKFIQKMDGVGEFLNELDDAIVRELLLTNPPKQTANILTDLPAEETVDILDNLPNNLSAQIQKLLNEDEREEVEDVLQYPDETAGRIMSTDFIAFDEQLTSEEALAQFKSRADEAEMPFYIYVINTEDKMVGVLSLRQMLLASSNTKLKNFMRKEFVSVSPEDDQETVANIVAQYNYLAIPVVKNTGTLIGIITVDDVIDIIREEASEDILKMAGAGEDREILLKSTWEGAKTRFPWLLASWFGGVIALTIIGAFESMLSNTIALAAFIPIIMGMGGNIGTQTSTIFVRGIATGRVNLNEVSKIIYKEIRIGVLLGTVYGFLLGILAYFIFTELPSPILLGLTVCISIFFAMVIACTIGALFPVILQKMDFDPAISTAPFVTTSVDICGVLVYFLTARLILNI